MQPLLSAGVLELGLGWGGPVEVVYGFLACFALSLFLAISLAEISSPFVTAGGPYNWAGALSGRLGKLPSYVVGWVTLLALFGGISTSVQASNQIMGMRMMFTYGDPASASTQVGQWGVAQACNLVGVFASLMPIEWTNRLSWITLVWLVCGSTILVILIPAVAPSRQSNAYVWGKWYNGSSAGIDQAGLGSQRSRDAYTVCNGLLMSQYLLLYYDTPSHMAEETHRSTWTVPRSIIASFLIGSAINFGLLLSFLYSIQIESNVYTPGAGITGTCYGGYKMNDYGTPVCTIPYSLFQTGNIFWDVFAARFPDKSGLPALNCLTGDPMTCPPRPSKRGRNGAIVCSFIVCIGATFSTMLGYASATRFIYSFARDKAFPPFMNRWLVYVHPKTKVPLGAVAFFGIICAAFTCVWLNQNPVAAFSAITGMNSNGLLLVYGMAPLLRLTTGFRTFTKTKDFDLKWLSIPAAVIGVIYAMASNATIALPSIFPITSPGGLLAGNLNFAPVGLGAVIALALLLYPFAVKFWGFTGPMQRHEDARDGLALQAAAKAVQSTEEGSAPA